MLQVSLHPYTLHFAALPAPHRGRALTTRSVWFRPRLDDAEPAVAGWGKAGPVPASAATAGTVAACANHIAAINAGAHPLLLNLDDLPAFASAWKPHFLTSTAAGASNSGRRPSATARPGCPPTG